jgi:hypothetical protein
MPTLRPIHRISGQYCAHRITHTHTFSSVLHHPHKFAHPHVACCLANTHLVKEKNVCHSSKHNKSIVSIHQVVVESIQAIVRKNRSSALGEGRDHKSRAHITVQESELGTLKSGQVVVVAPGMLARAEIARPLESSLEAQNASDQSARSLGVDTMAREQGDPLDVGRAAVVTPLARLAVAGDGVGLGPVRVGHGEVVGSLANTARSLGLGKVDVVLGEALGNGVLCGQLVVRVLCRRRERRVASVVAVVVLQVMEHIDCLVTANGSHVVSMLRDRRYDVVGSR